MRKSDLVKRIILLTLVVHVAALSFHSHGAAGDVDLSFDPGSGVNGPVNAVVLQSDGRFVIGGQFTTVRGLSRTNLARLNADGSGDETFDPTNVFDVVDCLALQPDGRVLVGSRLTEVVCDEFDCDYEERSIVTQLAPNGNIDSSFVPARANVGSGVKTLAVQSDGKVLLGGYFTTVNGTNCARIARLNTNGSFDGSFNPGSGVDGWPFLVSSVAVQGDGRILIGGGFTTFNETNRNGIARLNSDGSLDSAFNAGTNLGGGYTRVLSIVVQPDGKLLVGGSFTNGHGNGILRLNANGSLDPSFHSGTGANGGVASVAPQSDGKVVIGGYFTAVNGTMRHGVARLNASGGLDGSFNPSIELNAGVSSILLQSDGKVAVAGNFTTVHMARLNADGGLDSSFHPGRATDHVIASVVALPDGSALIGGLITFSNETNQVANARLNSDGSLDRMFLPSTFAPVIALTNMDFIAIRAFAVQPDGKVLLGGHTREVDFFDEFGNPYYAFRAFLSRVHPDGTADSSFPIARGNASFGWNPDSFPARTAALAVQPDGRILFGGPFTAINGTNRGGLARFHANGTLDSSFNPAFKAEAIRSLAWQADGKVIVGGGFTFGPPFTTGIARLNPDGSLDNTFNPGAGANSSLVYDSVYSVALQLDGKVILAGAFTNVNGTARNRIARLNPNGSVDASFDPGTGADALVRSIALQSDGGVLMAGDFLSVNGILRHGVARLYGDSVIMPSLNVVRSNSSMIISWLAATQNLQLQESTNLALVNAWSPVSQPAVTNRGRIVVTVPTSAGSKFFRLHSQ